MSIPHVSRQPLLRMVPADMEDEVLARFFQRSCSLADLAEFTGCTIRAISKWFEREDVQADLQRIARFAQGRTGYLLQESTHLIMQNHEHLMGLLGSDKFHYANSTTQARMMETARKAGNDLNKLRQDLDPNRPASTSHELKTSRAESSSRADLTSRDREGAGELPSAHHETKQLDPSPSPRSEPTERSSPIPQFKPAPIPDQHISEDAIARALAPSDDPIASDPAPSPAPARTPSPETPDPILTPDNPASTRSPSPESRDPSSQLDSPSTPSNPSVLHSEADRTDPSERGVSAGEPLVSTDQSRPP